MKDLNNKYILIIQIINKNKLSNFYENTENRTCIVLTEEVGQL